MKKLPSLNLNFAFLTLQTTQCEENYINVL